MKIMTLLIAFLFAFNGVVGLMINDKTNYILCFLVSAVFQVLYEVIKIREAIKK